MKLLPNILLILADDVGTGDVPGYWGNHIVNMPNLVKLQSQGVTFLDAHSTPLCAPTRYMLLSGNYAHRGRRPTGTWNFVLNDKNNFQSNQKSIAHVLKTRGGYHTAMFGKWHVGGGLPPPPIEGGSALTRFNRTHFITGNKVDWSKPLKDGPNDIGFDTSYFTTAGIQKPPYSFFRDGILDHDLSDVEYWSVGDYMMDRGHFSKISDSGEGSKDWDSASYNMILVNHTLSFFDDHTNTRPNDPFFAYVALGQVHTPHSPPTYYLDGTPIAGEYENDHLDLLFEMDKVIGTLVSTLENKGLANDTIFIFASDNGGLKMGYPGRVLRGSKSAIYEGGHRVPLVMRYDRLFPKNETRTSHFVGLNDLYATLADIVGVAVPSLSAQDSVSFAQYIQSEESTQGLREYLGTWAYRNGDIKGEAVRYGDFKLVRNFLTGNDELYNLKNDIGERNNIIHESQHKESVMEMYKVLKSIGPCPDDATGNVTLTNGKNAGKVVTCEWFQRNTRKRCKKQLVGKLLCGSICDVTREKFCSKYPNDAPTMT